MSKARLFPLFSYLYLISALFNPRIPILWSITLGLSVLCLLFSTKFKLKFKLSALKSQPFVLALLGYLAYYLLSALVWSEDLAQSTHAFSIQMPLLLTPLLFLWANPSEHELALLRTAWIRVVLGVMLLELSYSAWRYAQYADINVFFTDQLTALTRTHSSYFSMYLLATFAFILESKLPLKNLKSSISTMAILVFISVFAYMLGSKIVMLFFLCAWLILAYQLFKSLALKPALAIVGSCTLVLILWISLFKVNLNRYRGLSHWQVQNYADTRSELDQREPYDKERWTTISFRVALWQAGLRVFSQHPYFGVGVGDMQSSMRKEYQALNFHKALQDNSKLHNTFLDIGVESGLIGMALFFLSIFLMPLRANLGKSTRGDLLLLLALFISMQFESYTARVHYEIFLSLIICLLAYKPRANSMESSEK